MSCLPVSTFLFCQDQKNKPIIIYAPDYNEFLKYNGFMFDPMKENFAHKAQNLEQLNKMIKIYCQNQILFQKNTQPTVLVDPGAFQYSIDYLKESFYYKFHLLIETQGESTALMAICGIMVLAVFFSNFFKLKFF